MKKYILTVLTVILIFTGIFAQNKCPVIPMPNNVQIKEGCFKIGKKICVNVNTDELKDITNYLKESLNRFADIRIVKKSIRPSISLRLLKDSSFPSDGYNLNVEKDKIIIESSTIGGVLNGSQTLIQLCMFSPKKGDITNIACCSIKDIPRYQWRGLMLDESRTFFGEKVVKHLLDYMALYKLNKFHWHLTDDPGWRIEIKKYPKLTKVGGIGNYEDPEAKAQYYTQKEIRRIISYATKRGIEIIPEIDMPGHAASSNHAYPEFSGGGSERKPDFTFNPGKEETYQYLTNILKEVAELFPSSYIHIGGDEVNFGNQHWKEKPEVQTLMKENNLKDLSAVERYFIRRMADSIKIIGKKVMGWDEVIASGLDCNNTRVMWWRHDKPQLLKEALDKGYEVVMCPRIPMYFDFIQDEKHEYGRVWGGKFCSLENVYRFPPDTLDCDNKQIAGIQTCVWSERIQNNRRLDFMIFPRLSAMSEAAWTYNENKSLEGFYPRLKQMIKLYDKEGIYYFDVFNKNHNSEPVGIK